LKENEMDKKDRIKDGVRRILDEHSGGIKFTELIVEIASCRYLDISEMDADEIEKVIREMEDVKVLDYVWKSMNRAKMFVYTP
jgi:hypothetical protein